MAMTMSMKSIAGDAHFFEENMNLDRIRKLLDNKLGVAGHGEKLEAMKALLASISKGEDVSSLFADVVKNVIVASVEVKKLVYMYLVHYADANSQCRELALLSINSFQKDLADQNQLIRALALRVMTSIRVRDILQIQLIAIRKCAADESPYVRKCATNAISKVFVVDPDQKEVLAEIIGTLLNDASTMVLGSAVQALSEVCPDRLDLLHRPFRKLCHLLADIDEWGQTVTLNILCRYCRDQFQQVDQGDTSSRTPTTRPLPSKKTTEFYSDEEEDDDDVDKETKQFLPRPARDAVSPFLLKTAHPQDETSFGGPDELEDDHRLLLRSSLPLLKSRNSAVVLAVATLHYYCGTQSVATSTLIAKSLVRIMRNQREIQYVVLSVLSSMATSRPAMFRPFLHDFFVRATDPAYARQLKLEILTALVTQDNVSVILREFQAYVQHVDKSFVTMTVRALGRVADAMPSVAERCLKGLMRLVRSSSDQVVAESVVVLRQLLQQHEAIQTDRLLVVRSLAAMMVAGRVHSPMARASIIWMLGEFYEKDKSTSTSTSTCAAETLRLVVPNFADEATAVRLQLLNLAVKLGLRKPHSRPIQLLLQYVLELCKFDLDYDVRDRARLIRAALSGDRQVVDPHKLFASAKPAPFMTNYDEDSTTRQFTLGTLSNVVRHSVPGYVPLPPWRTTKPDPSLRDQVTNGDLTTRRHETSSSSSSYLDARKGKKKAKTNDSMGFYSDASSQASASASESSASDSSSDDESEESSHDDDDSVSASSSSGPESDASDVSSSSSEEEESEEEDASKPIAKPAPALDPLDLLGSSPLRAMPSNPPALNTSSSTLLDDLMGLTLSSSSTLPPTRHELLSTLKGDGLTIHYAFLRQVSTRLNGLQLWLANHSNEPISDIQLHGKHVTSFPAPLSVLFPGGSTSMVQVQVDFQGSLDAVPLEIVTSCNTYHVDLAPPVGELFVPLQVTVDDFERHIAMLESTCLYTSDLNVPAAPVEMNQIVQMVLKEFNVAPIYEINPMNRVVGKSKFAGRLRTTDAANAATLLIGLEIELESGKGRLLVAMRDPVLAQHLTTALKQALTLQVA